MWAAWTVGAAVSAVAAFTDRPWLAVGWVPVWAAIGLLAPRRLPASQFPAYRRSRDRLVENHPVRAMVRQLVGPAVTVAGFGLLMTGPNHQRLQALGMTVAVVGVVDLISLNLRNRSRFEHEQLSQKHNAIFHPPPNRFGPVGDDAPLDRDELKQFDGW